MVTLLENFEVKISTVEESCDLKTLSIAKLISKLQTQKQKSSMRNKEIGETALQASHKSRKFNGKDSRKKKL